MIVAQITDCHVTPRGTLFHGAIDTNARLTAVVADLLARQPAADLVIATGDLVDLGRPDEYAMLAEILAPLAGRLRLIPGNHDDRDALRAAFPDHAYLPATGYLHWAEEALPLRVIGLDSVVAGRSEGMLCPARLAWLAATLDAEPRRPALIALHHPPFAVGIGHMDAMAFTGADDLAEILRARPQAKRIVCGHLHRAVTLAWAGLVATVAPATAHQLLPDLAGARPASFVDEPPAYQLHLWRPLEGIVTHTIQVGPWRTWAYGGAAGG